MFTEEIERSDLDYFADTARSVEVVREENEQGRLGSFGFTLVQEKPPQIGVVVPGEYDDIDSNTTCPALTVYLSNV